MQYAALCSMHYDLSWIIFDLLKQLKKIRRIWFFGLLSADDRKNISYLERAN